MKKHRSQSARNYFIGCEIRRLRGLPRPHNEIEALKIYESTILGLCRYFPSFYRKDLEQDCRLCLCKSWQTSTGRISPALIILKMEALVQSNACLERNRGIVGTKKPIDWDDIAHKIKECSGWQFKETKNGKIFFNSA